MVIWKAKGKGRDIKIILSYKNQSGKDGEEFKEWSFVSTEALKTTNTTQLVWYTKLVHRCTKSTGILKNKEKSIPK